MESFLDNFCSKNSFSYSFTQEIEKMKNGELLLEDILNNNDIAQDLKTNTKSEFLSFLTNDIIFK